MSRRVFFLDREVRGVWPKSIRCELVSCDIKAVRNKENKREREEKLYEKKLKSNQNDGHEAHNKLQINVEC